MNSPDNKINKITSEKSDVIPVIQEQIKVENKVVETARFQVSKHTTENNHVIKMPLLHEEHTIEHVPVNVFVDDIPSIRYEGDTIIIPVLKEVLVKRILLEEEIRITKKTVQTNFEQTVTLQQQEVTINRVPSTGSNQ